MPTVRIGVGGGGAGQELHRVVGAGLLDDGRIVVADAGSSEIRYFSVEGKHVLTVGGEGEGPGELTGIWAMTVLPGGRVAVLARKPGLTVIDRSGHVIREERLAPSRLGTAIRCRMAEDWRLLWDVSLLGIFQDNRSPQGCGPVPKGLWRMSALVVRYEPDTGVLDTLGIVPGAERNGPDYRVFGRSLVLATADDLIFFADTGGDSIRSVTYEGAARPSLPIPFRAQPVPAAAKQREVRRMSGQPYDFPSTFPMIGRLLVGTDGLLWVAAYPEAHVPIHSWTTQSTLGSLGHRWELLWKGMDKDGEVSAELRTPPRFFPFEIGRDYILGLSWSELDVETIERYALVHDVDN